jgi:hypothetical protein
MSWQRVTYIINLFFCGQSSCNASYAVGNGIHTSITKEVGIIIIIIIIIVTTIMIIAMMITMKTVMVVL